MASLEIFELDDELEPNKNAKAKLLTWDGHNYVTRGAKSVIVYSFAGAHGVPGDRGYCFLGASNRWEVIGSPVQRSSFG
ncbi:MAG TPA: hypothetical protein VHV08_12370 [Pirellulales bacterium]|jgi:hypothetical protein|nr:hypothetical protein [Pirellulales bacterium]